jgi:hypothetical protein
VTNIEVEGLLIGVPEGHRHLRLVLETADGQHIVLQEATVAAIVRAYTTIKTHPAKSAVKMVSVERPEGLKKGYAEHQLIETDVAEGEVLKELGIACHCEEAGI